MIYDTIIIGAGAAGLMAAITAAKQGVKVLLLDGQPKIGAKILMSGGTRCNVTNKKVSEKDYNSTHLMRARNVLRAFDNAQAIAFFKSIGVDLVLEPTGKYFPVTNSGKTVLEALLNECKRLNAEIRCQHKVQAVQNKDNVFAVRGEGFEFHARTIVLTTGGLSYPTTGSDGVGYRIARGFGHHVIDTSPALTPLTTSDKEFTKLSGIALPVTLALYVNNKKTVSISDDFLIAHFGFSGPAALDMSRHYVHAQKFNPKLRVNFLPTETMENFQALLAQAAEKTPKRTVQAFLAALLPTRLAEMLLQKAGIGLKTEFNQMTRQERQQLMKMVIDNELVITGVVGYSKAEVTAGGVDLNEITPKDMQSTLQPGLFLAGEILDVDGRIGGFNFQWAWASGYVAGLGISKKLQSMKG